MGVAPKWNNMCAAIGAHGAVIPGTKSAGAAERMGMGYGPGE
jgi:hypothetical protein